MKKIFCVVLAMMMLFSVTSFAFAEGEGGLSEAPTNPQRVSGYASKFVSTSGEGSFNVYVSGGMGLTGGLTFKTSCDESDDAMTVVTIQRPNGGYLLYEDAFSANEEVPFNFLLPTSGTYTIHYNAFVPSGATLQMQCWIY